MRYLVYLLLLSNLGLFGWIYTHPPQAPQPRLPAVVPPGSESIVLLAERDGPPAPVAADEQAGANGVEAPEAVPGQSAAAALNVPAAGQPDPSAGAAPPPPVCLAVGPILGKRRSAAVIALLSSGGYSPARRAEDIRKPAGYWVYMPAMPAADARRIAANLDEKGMTDYFIGKQNYISLGIFSRKDKAQIRLKQVQSLGYDAILEQRYRTRTYYWLDFEGVESEVLDSTIWPQIQAQDADIQLQPSACR